MNTEKPANCEFRQRVKTEFSCYSHLLQTFIQNELTFLDILLSI